MTDRAIPVVELFGPTIQGEGPDAGTPCYFVRFGGCDYRCGYARTSDDRWASQPSGDFVCDSLHAVLPQEVRKASKLTAREIADGLTELPGDPQYVVFSGGNPLLHDLTELVEILGLWQWRVAVETQGSLFKDWLWKADTVVVSPKPPSSKQVLSIKQLDNFMTQLLRYPPTTVALKVPIFDRLDLVFANKIAEAGYEVPLYLSVVNDWRKPNTTQELLARYAWIIERAQDYDALTTAPVLPQMHVLVWGNERAR